MIDYSDDEMMALEGLSLPAQVIYFKVIRRYVDEVSLISGASRIISYSMMIGAISFRPSAGSTVCADPVSVKKVRCAVDELIRAGLISKVDSGSKRRLAFCLNLIDVAGCDVVESNNVVSLPVVSEKSIERGDCFVSEVADLYHKVLPELNFFTSTNEKISKQILILMEFMPELPDWQNYFEYVATSDYLMGRLAPGVGYKKPFQANLSWLTKKSSFDEISSGSHHVLTVPKSTLGGGRNE